MACALWGCGATLHAQQTRDYSGDCTKSGCHDDFTESAVVHHPVKSASCDGCHELSDEQDHKFELTAEGSELCFECHDETEGEVVHQPFGGGQCDACHNPHASATKGLLSFDSIEELCAECHDEVTEDLKFLHGPVAAGACTTCHNAHASDHATLLQAPERQLCLGCHSRMNERLTDSKHVHSTVKDGCGSCHEAHGADNKMMLTASMPDLCYECHDDIADLVDEATVQHDAVTSGQACARCHDAHASQYDHILVGPSMELCLSCHDRELKGENGTIVNVAQLLKDNPQHHGPIRDGECGACHTAHGGDHFRLLSESYPSRFYAAFDEDRYALCFDCHEPDMMLDAETDELTGFRNGSQNLHFVHVNREPKGRSCRACHNVHASRGPKLVAESVPFGSWNIPISFRATETGGSCDPGCHRAYRYDRENAVPNIPQ